MQRFRRLSTPEIAAIVVGFVLCFLFAWTLDDAYVYYRYVDNAVLWGRGLVYNEGEFVEGFSSPLWAILLLGGRSVVAALGALELGTYWNLQRAIGLASFLVFAGLCVRVNAALSPDETPSSRRLDLPLIHCSLHYSLLTYFTSGMETPLVLVAAAAYALHLLEPRTRWLGVWIGLTPLIRHELAVALLLTIAFLRWRHGRFFWTPLVSATLFGGSYLLFRIYMYADLLPNTFYLKNIWWISSGLLYVLDTLAAYWLPLCGIAALVLLRLRASGPVRKLPHASEVAMMLVIATASAAYVVKIGGDARHFRYLAFPYALAVLALGGGLLEHLEVVRGRRFALTAAGVIALTTALSHPVQLASHPLPQWIAQLRASQSIAPARTQRFGQFADAAFHRQPPIWSSRADLEHLPLHLPSKTTVRYAGNCWKIYSPYRADFVIHQAGLTDPFIARMALRFRRPGHPESHELAANLAELRRRFGRRGALRRAARAGAAPAWVVGHLDALEVVEAKAYNRHDLAENVRLALRFVDDLPLRPDAERPGPAE